MAGHPLLGRLYRGLSERVSILARLAKYELNQGTAVDISPKRRLWLWRRGFTSHHGPLFDLDVDNYRDYLSTVQHERSANIDNSWIAAARNKFVAHLLYGSFAEYLPDLYGIVERGTLKRTSPLLSPPPWQQQMDSSAIADPERVVRSQAVDWIDRYLDERSTLVLKPTHEKGGEGVLVCQNGSSSDRYEVNGDVMTRGEFVTLVEGLEDYLAVEFVEQADYAQRLFPDAANTIRVLTYWDYETDEPFVGPAVQRIGTHESAPVDNWSKGGLSAEITEDGTLNSGAQWLSAEGQVNWFDTHPDTGDRITGTPVPNWQTIREQILELASLYPHLNRIGWDVLLTDDGEFKLIEINPGSGMQLIQVHHPLLREQRVRRFYEHHDCL
jgi:hypothetical protein